MVVGIFMRHIKTYNGLNYIPLASEDRFCGIVGNNGIGKSSILEALDSVFNDTPINVNIFTKKHGLDQIKPSIIPLFLIRKDLIDTAYHDVADKISRCANELEESDVNPAHRAIAKQFIAHRDSLKARIEIDNFWLLPIGIDYTRCLTLGIFNCRKLVQKFDGDTIDSAKLSITAEQLSQVDPLYRDIILKIDYIYIPKEIDTESFTKLENDEIQMLMGETLTKIIEERVTRAQIYGINQSLNEFLRSLSSELGDYAYRTPTDRQQQLKRHDVYDLIIHSFFSTRKLHKKQGEYWLEIAALSSGEKQKAIIDIAQSLITNHRASSSNLIIGIDEPDSSLHMSACFDQFDGLFQISRSCMQLLFASHWYGFFPVIESGSASVISKNGQDHNVDLINLAAHREQIKQLKSESRGILPHDIRLKSMNDFIQSIMSSVIGQTPYNWILCEGSSEKVYLSHYLSDLVLAKKLRIIPVGGVNEIKRVYTHLSSIYDDFKDEINGRIYLICDTDIDMVRFETSDFDKLLCRRIVNFDKECKAKLVRIGSNPVSPATEIEDVLDGPTYLKTLKTFIPEYRDYLEFLTDLNCEGIQTSHYFMNFRHTEKACITSFFDSNKENKTIFAKRYIEILKEEEIDRIPEWVQEIHAWFSAE